MLLVVFSLASSGSVYHVPCELHGACLGGVGVVLNSLSLAGNLWLEEVNLIFVFSEAEIHS